MTTKTEALLWIDTETTAIEPRDGQLLEIGMILTDMQGNQLEPPRNWLIRHPYIRMTPTTAYAIDLHARNKLIDQTFEHGMSEDAVATMVHETLTALADRYVLHPAGTNPDFDLQWLKTGLGLQLTQLHYRKLDMTALRMLTTQVALGAWTSAPTDHRVTTCLSRDIREYTRILDAITALADGSHGHKTGEAL